MKLSIIMPAYNEAKTLKEITQKVLAVPLDIELIIVNDASTDSSREVLAEIEAAHPHQIRVYHHAVNQGKTAAIRTGIPYCTGDIITIQDGDLETEPNDLVRLTAPIISGEAQVVYGSRYLNTSESHIYYSYQLGGRVLSWMVNILYGQNITDEPTCYKVFRAEILKAIPITYDRFEFCPEVTAKVSKMGYKIKATDELLPT
jgi:dolichol-phosphate mannosyltransferase